MCCCAVLVHQCLITSRTAATASCCTRSRTTEQTREVPTNGSDADTSSGVTGHGAHLPLLGISTILAPPHRPSVRKRGLKPSGHWPHSSAFRQTQRRLVSGTDRLGGMLSMSGLTAQLHETLPDGAVIHRSDSRRGQASGVFQIVLGAAAIAGSFFTAGATLAAWGSHWDRWYDPTLCWVPVWCSVVWRRCGTESQDATGAASTDRQNTYFSSLDNMVAQGNVLPVVR